LEIIALMTRSELVTAIYAHFNGLKQTYRKLIAKRGFGALAFLPGGYERAMSYDQVKWEYWTVSDLETCLLKGGVSEGFRQRYLKELPANSRRGIQVVIVADSGDPARRELHLYRIGGLPLN
jgi:hypothetical protein